MYTLSGFFWFTTSACILLLDTRHGAQSSSRGTRAVCPSHSCVVVLVAVFSVEQKCEGSAEQPEYTVLTLKENVCLISPSKFTLVSTPTSMALFKCYLLRSVSKALHLVFIETALFLSALVFHHFKPYLIISFNHKPNTMSFTKSGWEWGDLHTTDSWF